MGEDQREVLLRELDGFLGTTVALYGQIGRAINLGDPASLSPDVALVVRARDQLAQDGPPWWLEGSGEELELLLGRLRASAELALERGAQQSPGTRDALMYTFDSEGTDNQLDVLSVADALLRRIEAAPSQD